jgi:hypothetical protein
MVRVEKLCEAKLINDYKCEAQNNRSKIGVLFWIAAKTVTKSPEATGSLPAKAIALKS